MSGEADVSRCVEAIAAYDRGQLLLEQSIELMADASAAKKRGDLLTAGGLWEAAQAVRTAADDNFAWGAQRSRGT